MATLGGMGVTRVRYAVTATVGGRDTPLTSFVLSEA